MVFQTNNLYFRQMIPLDFKNLQSVLQDRAALYIYGEVFTDDQVRIWLKKQLENYRKLGFGIWGIIRKHDEAFIGQGGLMLQKRYGKKTLDNSYILKHEYWHMGYGEEIVFGINSFALDKLGAPLVESMIPVENFPQHRAAKNAGMRVANSLSPEITGSILYRIDQMNAEHY